MSRSDWSLEHARVCGAVRELASLLWGNSQIALSDRQAYEVALALQERGDAGLIQGRVVTGDHYDEKNETVLDWEEFARVRE